MSLENSLMDFTRWLGRGKGHFLDIVLDETWRQLAANLRFRTEPQNQALSCISIEWRKKLNGVCAKRKALKCLP